MLSERAASGKEVGILVIQRNGFVNEEEEKEDVRGAAISLSARFLGQARLSGACRVLGILGKSDMIVTDDRVCAATPILECMTIERGEVGCCAVATVNSFYRDIVWIAENLAVAIKHAGWLR